MASEDEQIREQTAAASVARTDLVLIQDPDSPYAVEKATLTQLFASQVALREYVVPLTAYRVHDNLIASLPLVAANDDLGLVAGTFGTDAPVLQTTDSKAASHTLYGRTQWVVPYTYDEGQTLTLRANAGMNTTISDGTATLDLQCYRVAAPSTDICATAAQSINSLVAANKDFTITPTNVVRGDILDFRWTIAIVDSATGTAVIGEIGKTSFLADSTN